MANKAPKFKHDIFDLHTKMLVQAGEAVKSARRALFDKRAELHKTRHQLDKAAKEAARRVVDARKTYGSVLAEHELGKADEKDVASAQAALDAAQRGAESLGSERDIGFGELEAYRQELESAETDVIDAVNEVLPEAIDERVERLTELLKEARLVQAELKVLGARIRTRNNGARVIKDGGKPFYAPRPQDWPVPGPLRTTLLQWVKTENVRDRNILHWIKEQRESA